MATLQQRGATMLSRTHKAAGGFVGTYYRNQTATPGITATVAEKEYEVIDASGALTLMQSHDWVFTAADLTSDGEAITPRPRDRWKVTINGTEETYEVLPMGNKPCYERLDTSGILLLVHTKKVA